MQLQCVKSSNICITKSLLRTKTKQNLNHSEKNKPAKQKMQQQNNYKMIYFG